MSIPLSMAWLCVTCELVVETTATGVCPKCLGGGLLALARILNRSGADLESPEFYELMQAYRHTPVWDQPATIAAFEAVKAFIRK